MLLKTSSLEAEPEAGISVPMICWGGRGALGRSRCTAQAEAWKSEDSAGLGVSLIPWGVWGMSCTRVASL